MIPAEMLDAAIQDNARAALTEDIGNGDITAALIPVAAMGKARVITREPMVLAGSAWANAVFALTDSRIQAKWLVEDGQHVDANTALLLLEGPARSLLTAERAALNFLQTLSGTATVVRQLVSQLEGTSTRLLDTRKTLPGLRIAQKYAVATGGGKNHRLGLFDAFLIKENHIAAAGSIAAAVSTAREIAPDKPVEVEVESMQELDQALAAGADIIMLDNFSMEAMQQAVIHTAKRALLEASGGIHAGNLRSIAMTGVDYISMGALTKDVKAIDLSMRFID
ncbi:MAG: carboxylating nicotinate-nucleotide diphosphorylase [Pedobacter sp.]|nr:carboxylating nicotinate-nucleotide diphosphorylase [Pedobacter sp.]